MERAQASVARAPTILDVAVEAGVSKSAVSRALSGQAEVSEATKQRVEQAAARLGYVANGMARGLRAKTYTIGAVLRDLTRPFYGELLAGMQQGAECRGYQVITVTSSGDLDVPDALRTLKSLISLQVDGLVIASAQLPSADIVPFVDRTPIVVSGRAETTPGITSVFSDEAFGGQLLADHLLDLGHRRVAVAVVDQSYSLSQHARGTAMAQRLRDAGALADVWPVDRDADVGMTVAARLGSQRVTAVMCPTDGSAVDVLEVLRARGMGAPSDLTVTGHDAVGPLAAPFLGLTSYEVPVLGMGRASVNLLVDKIENNSAGDRLAPLRGELVQGRTAGPPPSP